MPDFPVTIYHKSTCSTSRNVLAMIKEAGYAPKVVNYMEAGWTPKLLGELATSTGLGVRGLLRVNGTPAEELGLTDPSVSDKALIAAMVEHPILVNRPIVVTPKGAALVRPVERLYDLLERKP